MAICHTGRGVSAKFKNGAGSMEPIATALGIIEVAPGADGDKNLTPDSAQHRSNPQYPS